MDTNTPSETKNQEKILSDRELLSGAIALCIAWASYWAVHQMGTPDRIDPKHQKIIAGLRAKIDSLAQVEGGAK